MCCTSDLIQFTVAPFVSQKPSVRVEKKSVAFFLRKNDQNYSKMRVFCVLKDPISY